VPATATAAMPRAGTPAMHSTAHSSTATTMSAATTTMLRHGDASSADHHRGRHQNHCKSFHKSLLAGHWVID
jgi:hypothetical protein